MKAAGRALEETLGFVIADCWPGSAPGLADTGAAGTGFHGGGAVRSLPEMEWVRGRIMFA
jgi:hypothetical protein